jgi:hypothetical protein
MHPIESHAIKSGKRCLGITIAIILAYMAQLFGHQYLASEATKIARIILHVILYPHKIRSGSRRQLHVGCTTRSPATQMKAFLRGWKHSLSRVRPSRSATALPATSNIGVVCNCRWPVDAPGTNWHVLGLTEHHQDPNNASQDQKATIRD